MNKNDRKELARAAALLEEAQQIVSDLADAEREKFDNLNEGLQASENGQRFSENADALDTARDDIEAAVDSVGSIE